MHVDLGKLRARTTDDRVLRVISALEVQPLLNDPELAAIVNLARLIFGTSSSERRGFASNLCSLEVRLLHARGLLITTFLSIKEIRNDVGFRDGSNFDHYFKERFFMSPSDSRDAFRNRLDQ